MTLIELMVALAIGAFLMIGAITVFMQSRTTFRVTESVSRLQENARFALDALEPDIRMAHFWGLTTRTESDPRARSDRPIRTASAPDTCGNNWTINLERRRSRPRTTATASPARASRHRRGQLGHARRAPRRARTRRAGRADGANAVYLQSNRGGGLLTADLHRHGAFPPASTVRRRARRISSS